MNWNDPQTMPPEMSAELYETAELISVFCDLARDGYSGLGLGLIIDLIRRDCTRLDDEQIGTKE
jgi:hypothetical protein